MPQITANARSILDFLADEAITAAKADIPSRESRKARAAIAKARLAFDSALWRLEDERPLDVEAKSGVAAELHNFLISLSHVANALLVRAANARTEGANDAKRASREPVDAKIKECADREAEALRKRRPSGAVAIKEIAPAIASEVEAWRKAVAPGGRTIGAAGVAKRLRQMKWGP